MKIKTFFMVCALAVSPLAYAHLGETLEETGQRYGEPYLAIKDGVIYKKNGFEIGTLFVDGKVEGVTYKKLADKGFLPEKITDDEILEILKSNAPTKEFQSKNLIGKKAFMSTDGDIYCDYDLFNHRMVIMTMKGRRCMEEKKAQEAKTSTGGL